MKRRDFLKALGITAGAFALPVGLPWPKHKPLPVQGDTASTVVAGINTETFTFWRNRPAEAGIEDLVPQELVPKELAAAIEAEPVLDRGYWGLSDLTISGPSWNRDMASSAFMLKADDKPLWSWSPSRHSWAEGHELLFPAGAKLTMEPVPTAWTAIVRRGPGDFVMFSDNTAGKFIRCVNPDEPNRLLRRGYEDELAWRHNIDIKETHE